MNLNAYIIEESVGAYGDISKAGPICFDMFDYTGKLIRTDCANLIAMPNPDPGGPPTVGYAEVSVPQKVGIYCITVRQQEGNGYYTIAPREVTTVVNCEYVAPIKNGVPQSIDINPDTAPVFDNITGQPIIDPLTGLQATKRTWKNYMFFATPCQLNLPTILQSVSLQKIIPERKVACGAGWTTEPTVVTQRGIQDIQTVWPLLYEVDGTELRLTVQYNTTDRRAYPSNFGPNISSRSHLETFSWFVKSNALVVETSANQLVNGPQVENIRAGAMLQLDLEGFLERLNFFARMPAGTCETFAVTPVAYMKIMQYINGYGEGQNFQSGIMQLIAMDQQVAAGAKFSALEGYMDSVCLHHLQWS